MNQSVYRQLFSVVTKGFSNTSAYYCNENGVDRLAYTWTDLRTGKSGVRIVTTKGTSDASPAVTKALAEVIAMMDDNDIVEVIVYGHGSTADRVEVTRRMWKSKYTVDETVLCRVDLRGPMEVHHIYKFHTGAETPEESSRQAPRTSGTDRIEVPLADKARTSVEMASEIGNALSTGALKATAVRWPWASSE